MTKLCYRLTRCYGSEGSGGVLKQSLQRWTCFYRWKRFECCFRSGPAGCITLMTLVSMTQVLSLNLMMVGYCGNLSNDMDCMCSNLKIIGLNDRN